MVAILSRPQCVKWNKRHPSILDGIIAPLHTMESFYSVFANKGNARVYVNATDAATGKTDSDIHKYT